MKLSVIQGILHNTVYNNKRDEHRMRVSLSAEELKTMTGCNNAQEAKDKGWRATLLGESFGFQHVGMVKSKTHKDGSFCLDIDYVRVKNKDKSAWLSSWKHKPGCNVFIPVSKVGLKSFKQRPVNRYPEKYSNSVTEKKSFKLEIPEKWYKKTTKPPAAAGVFTSVSKSKTAPILGIQATVPSLTPVLTAGANTALAKSVRDLNNAAKTWAKINAHNPNTLLRMVIQNGQLVVSVTTTTDIL